MKTWWHLVVCVGILTIDVSTGQDDAVDVCFAIDRFISRENWTNQLNFVKLLSDYLDIETTLSRVGVVSYDQLSYMDIRLSENQDLAQKISDLRYFGSQRAVDQAIRRVRTECFVETAGDRANVPNIVILVVAGPTGSAIAIYEAGLLRDTGARVIAIGVGPDVDRTMMKDIADNEVNLYQLPTFDELLKQTGLILQNVSPKQVAAKFPVLNQPPMIGDPVIDGASFSMPCILDYEHKTGASYIVVFSLDDVDIGIDPITLTSPNKVASFPGERLQDNLDKTLKCKVTSFMTNDPNKIGPPTYSAGYFVGIKISTDDVTISEVDKSATGGSPNMATIHINPTIPIVCPAGTDPCQLDFDITASPILKIGQVDVAGMEPQHVCTYTLKQEDMINNRDMPRGKALIIKPTPMTIGKTPPVTKTTISFSVIPQMNEKGPVGFNNYQLGSIQVNCLGNNDPGRCKATGDPHPTTFDGFWYTAAPVKLYWLVRNPTQYVYIQVATKAWTNGVAVICGVAIHWGTHQVTGSNTSGVGEKFFIDVCGGTIITAKCQNQMGGSISLVGNTYTLQEPGMVKVTATLRTFGGFRFSDVGVDVPASYFTQTDGLCGTFNANPSDDYLGGTLSNHLILTEVPSASSYFSCPQNYNVPVGRRKRQTEDEEHVHYCTCTAESKAANSCSIGPKPQGTNVDPPIFLGGGRPLTKITGDVLHGYTPPDITTGPAEDIPIPDWGELGVTEQEAEDACQTALEAAPFYATCSKYTTQNDMDAFMFGCKADIRYTGDMNWTTSHVGGHKGTCANKIYSSQTIAEENIDDPMRDSSYKINVGGFLNNTCSKSCSEHGTCNNGICECSAGYVGADCSLEKTTPPEPLAYLDPADCDVADEPCTSVKIRANKLTNSPQLSCRLMATTANNKQMDDTFPGELLTPETIRCPLYDLLALGTADRPTSYTYSIALSNDNTNFADVTTTQTRRVSFSAWTSGASNVGLGKVILFFMCTALIMFWKLEF